MFNRVGNAPRGQPVRNARGGARRLNGRNERGYGGLAANVPERTVRNGMTDKDQRL